MEEKRNIKDMTIIELKSVLFDIAEEIKRFNTTYNSVYAELGGRMSGVESKDIKDKLEQKCQEQNNAVNMKTK